jgi:hypothetical protein
MYVLKRLAVGVVLAAAAVTLTACSFVNSAAQPPKLSQLSPVMSGTGSIGSYDIRVESTVAPAVAGTGPWGDFGMSRIRSHQQGTHLLGSNNVGQISLIWSGKQISGSAGENNVIKATVTATHISGSTEWGSFSLTLKGQTLSGDLPIGSANFQIAPGYHGLTDLRILMSIMCVLSGKD